MDFIFVHHLLRQPLTLRWCSSNAGTNPGPEDLTATCVMQTADESPTTFVCNPINISYIAYNIQYTFMHLSNAFEYHKLLCCWIDFHQHHHHHHHHHQRPSSPSKDRRLWECVALQDHGSPQTVLDSWQRTSQQRWITNANNSHERTKDSSALDIFLLIIWFYQIPSELAFLKTARRHLNCCPKFHSCTMLEPPVLAHESATFMV